MDHPEGAGLQRADRGEKRLFSGQIQANMPSIGSLLGECRMKHKLLFQVLIIVNVSVGGAVVAQSPNSPFAIARDCVRALENGEMERVQLFVENILSWEDAAPSVARRAEQCVAAIHGDQFAFVPRLGWATQQEITAYHEELAIAKKQADLDMKRRIAESNLEEDIEDALVAYKATNQGMIEQETYRVCIALYEDKKSEVLLNPVCQASFKQFKHPEMSDEASFVTSVIKEKYPNPSEAERAALTNLGLDP